MFFPFDSELFAREPASVEVGHGRMLRVSAGFLQGSLKGTRSRSTIRPLSCEHSTRSDIHRYGISQPLADALSPQAERASQAVLD